LQPVVPTKFVSEREKRDRDVVMTAVAQKIYRDRIPANRMIIHGRPMLTAVRADPPFDEFPPPRTASYAPPSAAMGTDTPQNDGPPAPLLGR